MTIDYNFIESAISTKPETKSKRHKEILFDTLTYAAGLIYNNNVGDC